MTSSVSAGLGRREMGSARRWRSETVPTRPVRCGHIVTQIVTHLDGMSMG
jgi:hypothetical protein